VHAEADAQDGKPAYVDGAERLSSLPAELRGADQVRAAEADRFYSAVDLMEVAVAAGTTVFVAHDDRLARPAWLVQQFRPTAGRLLVGGQPMTVFRRRAESAESLTLGSNVEGSTPGEGHMYVVFVGGRAQ
jgi:beta-galactosidase